MPVRRKPKVEDFIRGAAKKKAETLPEKVVQPVKLRLDSDLIERIDDAVTARRPVPSRHQWILEAIYEKLERAASTN